MNKFLNLVGLSTFNDKINAKLSKKIDKTSIENTLTSTEVSKVLSAHQGKILNDEIKKNIGSIDTLKNYVLENYTLKDISLTDTDFKDLTNQESMTKIVRACASLRKNQFFNFEVHINDSDTPNLKKIFEENGFLFFNFEGDGNHRCIYENENIIMTSVYGKINDIKIPLPKQVLRTHRQLNSYTHKQLKSYTHKQLREKVIL